MKKWNIVTAWNRDMADKMRRAQYLRHCFCVGPQNGEPLCPCRMRDVTVKDGRYIEIIDHGPVRIPTQEDFCLWR